MVTLLGIVCFAAASPQVMMVMEKASHAPSLASSANQAAFNLANAGGAWVGGLIIAGGFGLTAPAVAGAVLAVSGLAIAVTAGWLERRSPEASRVIAGGVAHPEPQHVS
jgi:DHA1 family inner membrane transport protein